MFRTILAVIRPTRIWLCVVSSVPQFPSHCQWAVLLLPLSISLSVVVGLWFPVGTLVDLDVLPSVLPFGYLGALSGSVLVRLPRWGNALCTLLVLR